MNIICIANNIKGNYDGIGKHARIVGNEFKACGHQVEYCSGTTWNKSTFQKFVSFEMCKAFCSAIHKEIHGDYDYVVIEYPFAEYNPLILLFNIILYLVTRFTCTRIAFSMHEYDRVSFLRRLIIDCFLPFTDIIFISEKKYKTELSKYAMKMYIRRIPSHGVEYIPGEKDFENKNQYCYFGLVNRSKAFSEMMKAWQKFNERSRFILHIVTDTDLADYHLEKYNNVHYHYQLSDVDAGKVLSKCVYSIVPVVPDIGFNNSSFVSSIQCGCIPIGKFNDQLVHETFIVNTNSYDENTFCKTLESTQMLKTEQIRQMEKLALSFGNRFTVHNTVRMMIEGFQDYESKNKR